MLTLAWEGIWGAAPLGPQSKRHAVRVQASIDNQWYSGNEAIVRYGVSCQAAAGPLCSQATVAG